jgi:D-cysteine desulfhydrase
LPTPVQKLDNLGRAVGCNNIWIKHDDRSSDLYGGNKVRKLEFVLPDAVRKKRSNILTYGGIGTNHGLATTIHGKRLGLKTILIMIEQPLDSHVQENMLLNRHFGAELCYAGSRAGALLNTARYYLTRPGLYLLPPGGSSVLGSLGYVNAAFELKKQVDAGEVPNPKYIFVTVGSKGTMAGLLLGARLSGLDTTIVGVRVSTQVIPCETNTAKLANNMNKLLHKYDPAIPLAIFNPDEIHIIHDFYGGAYGKATPEGEEARDLLWKTDKLSLELTYTGKTVAAMLDYIKKHPEMNNDPVLYWHTYNGVDLSKIILEDHDYTRLPRPFHRFFETNLISYI